MSFKKRTDIHLARKVWHFCGVMTIFCLYCFLTPSQALWIALPAAFFMIGFDFLRLQDRRLNKFFTWLFKPFLRESERNSLAGSTALMAAIPLVIAVFPKNVVLLSLLFFAVADPLASYFGIRYGRDRLIGQKTLQGSMAAFAASFLITVGFCMVQDLMTERLFIVSLLAGFIGAFSELIPIGRLDDNFVFPVVSATLLSALFYVFGGH